ncbi:integrase core domain-containing protein [Streptomyces sp. P9-A2]|uniref:integrase core domain-containing protein n=1 Tax=Streptomyces sp. P9-A2 TaxID=3072284 RepID=UPI003FCD396F
MIGSSTDNALAESFDATFKRETLQGRKTWSSEREARLDAFRRLNRYNTRRRHSRLGHRSPIAYEAALDTTSTPLAQAAQPVSRIPGQGPCAGEVSWSGLRGWRRGLRSWAGCGAVWRGSWPCRRCR